MKVENNLAIFKCNSEKLNFEPLSPDMSWQISKRVIFEKFPYESQDP